MTRRRKRVLGGGVGLALFGLGMLTGIATERVRFDQRRTDVVRRYERLSAERRAELMERERAALGVTSPRRP